MINNSSLFSMKILKFFQIIAMLLFFNIYLVPCVGECGEPPDPLSPLILQSFSVDRQPKMGEEYNLIGSIYNPNSISIPIGLSITESSIGNTSFDITSETAAIQSTFLFIPSKSSVPFSFTYKHNGNPFSVMSDPITNGWGIDGKFAEILKSAINQIISLGIGKIQSDGLDVIWDGINNNATGSIGNIPLARFNYYLSDSPNSVQGLPTSLQLSLHPTNKKEKAYYRAIYEQIISSICTYAGVFFVPIDILLSVLLWACEILWSTISNYSLSTAIDPDENFTLPIVEDSFKMPGLDLIPDNPLKDFEKQLEVTASHQKSAHDAYTKYLGAVEADNTTWEVILLKKTYLYESKLVNDNQILSQMSVTAMKQIQNKGFQPDMEDANDTLNYIRVNGLPDYEITVMKEMGYSDEAINDTQELIVNSPPELLVNYDTYLIAGIKSSLKSHLSILEDISHELGDMTPPFANFTVNVTDEVSPLLVQFNDLSLYGPDYWYWDFGDGINSTVQNPAHLYDVEGNYSVNLTVTNISTGNDTRIMYNLIRVRTLKPMANFTANPVCGTLPLNVTFTDLSTGNPTQWYWDFGDGINSTVQNPVHLYDVGGNYSVNLTVTNISTGSDSRIIENLITVTTLKPIANFTANPVCGTLPLNVTFTDLSTGYPTQWHWDFGDGINSTIQNPAHLYDVEGNYSVNLTVTNISTGSDSRIMNNLINVMPI